MLDWKVRQWDEEIWITNASSGVSSRPKGAGKSIGGPASMFYRSCQSNGHISLEFEKKYHAVAGSLSKSKGCWASGNCPLRTALKFGGLVELGGQIQEINFRRGFGPVRNDNQRVDLEVSELALHIYSV